MKNQGNSMQSQNPIAQAQQSLDHVHNAVSMAESHPTEQMIEQAQNSIAKAERAVAQAAEASDTPNAVQLVQEELEQEKEALNKLL